ncbi:MAG: transporter periplasmic ligand-binding protein [Xanthobacteraceae bacterium]|nr:transporter periplasmic ligand-binding protein [Xanthobacteraceae bacterium]
MEQNLSAMASKLRSLAKAFCLAAAIISVGPVARDAAAQPVTVPAAVIGVSLSIWPAIVAREKGFFEEEGLRIDIISAGSSARSLQQVAAGVASFGSSSMVDTVRAIEAGAELKAFTNSLAVGTHSLIASKSIKSIKDLKGKRVMTGGQGDVTNLWWRAAARHHGLDPNKDVELLFSGSTGNRMSALFAGGIDATVLSTPQSFKAIEDGWTDLGPVAPYLGEFPMMIWHVNTDWAKANEKAVVGFVRAHNKAVRYLINPANRQEVSEMLARASNSGVEDALKTWDLCVKINAFVPDGSLSEAAVKRVSETLLESGDIKPPAKPTSAFYDDRFVRAAAK